jgi:hypothetical protein
MEHELNLLNGKTIVIVRDGFGTQSDSWVGQLTVLPEKYPLGFHFQSTDFAIYFTADDVLKLDDSIDKITAKIIRLKGPNDYAQVYQISH